eukprot:gene25160-28442_t
MITAAIRVNEEDIVRYLDTRGYEWPSGATALAAELGHLNILRYAAGTNRAPSSAEIMLAVANGHVDCLKYIYELGGCRDKYRLVTECVRHGQLECLQYVHSVCLVDKEENLCAVAVTHRHLPILSYLLSIGCSIYEDCASLAAYCVKYLHEQGIKCDAMACAAAAFKGHLPVLEYLHEAGCPWDENTTRCAASGGHMHCLKYAHERGCVVNIPVGSIVWEFDVSGEAKEQCLEYLTSHNMGEYLYDHACVYRCQWSLQYTCVGDSVFVWVFKDPGNSAAAPQELSSLPYIYNPVESLCDTVSFLHFYSGLANAVAVGLL